MVGAVGVVEAGTEGLGSAGAMEGLDLELVI